MWCSPIDEETFSILLHYDDASTKGSFKVGFEVMQMEANKFSFGGAHKRQFGRPSEHEK